MVAVSSFTERVRKAWRVFREDPDEVVTVTDRDDGAVNYTHQSGSGVARDREVAMVCLANRYSRRDDPDAAWRGGGGE